MAPQTQCNSVRTVDNMCVWTTDLRRLFSTDVSTEGNKIIVGFK